MPSASRQSRDGAQQFPRWPSRENLAQTNWSLYLRAETPRSELCRAGRRAIPIFAARARASALIQRPPPEMWKSLSVFRPPCHLSGAAEAFWSRKEERVAIAAPVILRGGCGLTGNVNRKYLGVPWTLIVRAWLRRGKVKMQARLWAQGKSLDYDGWLVLSGVCFLLLAATVCKVYR